MTDQVFANGVDRSDDGNVAVGEDGERDHIGADEEAQDEDAIGPAGGQVIEAAGRQIALGNVVADAEERKCGEEQRVEPDDADDQRGPSAGRLSPHAQRMAQHLVAINGDGSQRHDR